MGRKSIPFKLPPQGCGLVTFSQVVGALFVRRRLDLGMSQREFAPLVGLSKSSIVEYEYGRFAFSMGRFILWSKALDLDPLTTFTEALDLYGRFDRAEGYTVSLSNPPRSKQEILRFVGARLRELLDEWEAEA